AVVDGRIYFGCDDGYFYVLGPEGKREPIRDEKLDISRARAKRRTDPRKPTVWPSTYGNGGNTSFVDDTEIKPPLRVRWAARGFGHQLAPCLASGNDLLTVTLNGLITCQEQSTGRMRWRVQMPGPEWSTSSGMLVDEGRVFVPRPTFGRM